MPNTVTYRGQSVNGPSPDLWHDCPVLELLENPGKGVYGFDNFTRFGTATAAATDVDGYNIYRDTGVVLAPFAAQGGGLEVSGNDADNDEGSIQAGGGGLVISDTAANARKLWFECRIKKASIADNACAFFVGLMTPGSAAADVLVDNTGAIAASKSYLGFRCLHDNGEELDVVFGDNAGTVQEWAANIDTLVADTYVKLGFKYDPDHLRKIRIWIDGVEYTTDYIDAADIAAATFPDGDVMAPILATKVGAAAESKVQMAWWRWAQFANG